MNNIKEILITMVVIGGGAFLLKKIMIFFNSKNLKKTIHNNNIDLTQPQTLHIYFYSDWDKITPQEFHKHLHQTFPYLKNPKIQKYTGDPDLEEETGSAVWEVFYTVQMIPNIEELKKLKDYQDMVAVSLGGEFDGVALEYTDANGTTKQQRLTL